MRTHICGEVNEQYADQAVTLCGWVDGRRDLGGLIFIGLRDHGGIVQVVVDAEVTRNEDGSIHVVSRFEVNLSDYEISRPKFLMLKLDEVQKITVDVRATPTPSEPDP